MTSDMVDNGKYVKKFISIPTIPAWISALVIIGTMLYSIIGTSFGIERDIEQLQEKQAKQEAKIAATLETVQIQDEMQREVQRDLDEMRFNLKRLMEHQGIQYIER